MMPRGSWFIYNIVSHWQFLATGRYIKYLLWASHSIGACDTETKHFLYPRSSPSSTSKFAQKYCNNFWQNCVWPAQQKPYILILKILAAGWISIHTHANTHTNILHHKLGCIPIPDIQFSILSKHQSKCDHRNICYQQKKPLICLYVKLEHQNQMVA